jgi:hypothetical protein
MGFGLQTRTGEENRDSLMLEVDLFWDRGSISKTTKSLYCAFTGLVQIHKRRHTQSHKE